MYPNPIVINDGAANRSFDYRGSGNEQSSYRDATAPLDQPHTISIKHTVAGKGSVNQTRRTLVRIDKVVENAEGVQGTLSAYVVLVVPEKVATSAQCTAELTLLSDFLMQTGFIAKIVAQDL